MALTIDRSLRALRAATGLTMLAIRPILALLHNQKTHTIIGYEPGSARRPQLGRREREQ